jgi:hypothetical protein
MGNTTGGTSGAGTANPSGTPGCRKMSQSARKIGRNYATLISSEKSFNDLLGDLPDLNESLGEELENTSMTQQDLIGVEGGMKGEYKTKHTTQIQYLCIHTKDLAMYPHQRSSYVSTPKIIVTFYDTSGLCASNVVFLSQFRR